MSDAFAKENTDYWAVAFRHFTNDDFESTWGIDMLWKLPLPSSKDVFDEMLCADASTYKEPKAMTDISRSFHGMILRGRYNPDIVGPYVFMTDEGLFKDEDDFGDQFDKSDKLAFMKMIKEHSVVLPK